MWSHDPQTRGQIRGRHRRVVKGTMRPPLLAAVLSLLACIPATLSGVTSVPELTVLEGRTVAAPCHYDASLAGLVKYWCRGTFKDLCSMRARTDTPRDPDPRVTIVDDPARGVFTVTMADLREDETGWYHCGVEKGGMWIADASTPVYLHVVHGMSVATSRVSGEEGGSVAVDCLYSKRYRDGEKRWCRSGAPDSCVSTGPDGRYDGSSVTIADDGVGAFRVAVRDLQAADAGWYWCGAGPQQTQAQAQVQVLVTPRPSTTAPPITTRPITTAPITTVPITTALLTTAPITTAPPLVTPPPPVTPPPVLAVSPERNATETLPPQRPVLEAAAVCLSFTLVIGVVLLTRKMWRRHKRALRRRQAGELKARLSVCPEEVDDASIVFLNVDTQKADIF
ncbi:unnamed protein product [Merluccius merluccius]